MAKFRQKYATSIQDRPSEVCLRRRWLGVQTQQSHEIVVCAGRALLWEAALAVGPVLETMYINAPHDLPHLLECSSTTPVKNKLMTLTQEVEG